MDYQDLIGKFRKKSNALFNDPEAFQIHARLGLLYRDPSDTEEMYSFQLKRLSEKYLMNSLSIMTKIKNGNFDSITNFNSRYNDTMFDVRNYVRYFDSVFEQWDKFYVDNNLDSSKFLNRKEELKTELNKIVDIYERYSDFINKYKIIESFYVRNKFNKKAEPLLKADFDKLIDDNKDLLEPHIIQSFAFLSESNPIRAIFQNYQEVIEGMRTELNDYDPNIVASVAEKFIYDQKNKKTSNDILNFLHTKEYSNNIEIQMVFSQNQKVQELIYFKDNSIAIKEKGEEFKVVKIEDINEIEKKLIHSVVDYTLRKKPNIAAFFKTKVEEDRVSADDVLTPINTYLDNEQILKNQKFDLSKYRDKSLERLDDDMSKSIYKYKVERYANSVLSNKYKHFLNEETFKHFKDLYDSGVSEQSLQDFVGKKLAALKTDEEFAKFLAKVANQIDGFTPEKLEENLQNYNIEPIFKDNDIYVFEVKTFEESKGLGSPSWCISRTQNYFDNYTVEGNKQYFIYDFNRTKHDTESMIGITLYNNGDFRAQHKKDDVSMYVNDFLKDIRKKIIIANHSDFKLSEEIKASLPKEIVEKINTSKSTIKNGM